MASMNGHTAHLLPNLYTPGDYFQLDIGPGRLTSRTGAKMVSLSATMLRGLYVGLKSETGPAWPVVLRRCGETWGLRYAKRFLKEIAEFYGEGLDTMKMSRFSALLSENLAAHGWGRAEIDYCHVDRGIIVIHVAHPILAEVLKDSGDVRVDVLLAGLFKSLFCEVTGKDLDCVQTDCATQGKNHSRFIITLKSRLEPAEQMITDGASHDDIMKALLQKS